MAQFLEFTDASTGAIVYLNRSCIVSVQPVAEDKLRGRTLGAQSGLLFQDGQTRMQVMGAAIDVVQRLSDPQSV